MTPDVGGTCGFSETVLYSFAKNGGSDPHGRLAISSDGGVLFGMTRKGGSHSLGVIFEYVIATGRYCALHNFGGCAKTDGAESDHGNLTMSGSTLYGLTTYGGTHGCESTTRGTTPGDGVMFAIDPPPPPSPGQNCASPKSVEYKVLYDFGSATHDGKRPYGSLLASGEHLYGTTASGGSCKDGTVFDFKLDSTNPLKPDINRGSGSASCTWQGGTITECYGLNQLFLNLTDQKLSGMPTRSGH